MITGFYERPKPIPPLRRKALGKRDECLITKAIAGPCLDCGLPVGGLVHLDTELKIRCAACCPHCVVI